MPDRTSAERRLEAARVIRSYLPELLSADEAQAADRVIVHFLELAQDDPSGAADAVSGLFDARPSTRHWFSQTLDHDRLLPPELQEWEARGVEPIGGLLPVQARRFVCPSGDFVRYQRTVGQDMGECPTHHVALVAG